MKTRTRLGQITKWELPARRVRTPISGLHMLFTLLLAIVIAMLLYSCRKPEMRVSVEPRVWLNEPAVERF